MSPSQDTNERRQAIWPWLLMPVVVLIVFCTLQRLQNSAREAAAQATQVHSAASAGSDTVEP
jgi:hypothetical protein